MFPAVAFRCSRSFAFSFDGSIALADGGVAVPKREAVAISRNVSMAFPRRGRCKKGDASVPVLLPLRELIDPPGATQASIRFSSSCIDVSLFSRASRAEECQLCLHPGFLSFPLLIDLRVLLSRSPNLCLHLFISSVPCISRNSCLFFSSRIPSLSCIGSVSSFPCFFFGFDVGAVRTVTVHGSAAGWSGTYYAHGFWAIEERLPESSVSFCCSDAFEIFSAGLVLTLGVPAIVFDYCKAHCDGSVLIVVCKNKGGVLFGAFYFFEFLMML